MSFPSVGAFGASAPAGMPQPLKGLRVLDMTQFLSGPYATMILGDLGAEVIKVEPPAGELARTIPPHFIDGDSAYFLSINRSKQSLALDLKNPEGMALLRKLALECDIIVENFRPGVLNRLGLVYTELAALKPELIWCSISGFGQDGPYRDYPAYDMIVQALSGGMSMTGEPEGKPVRAGIPIGDLSAGLFSVIGVLAALNECRQTGHGKQIDIAMLDCQVSMLCYQAAYYLHSGSVPGRQGTAHDSIPTYRTFVAGDGISVVVTANTERMWQDMAKVLGLEHLLADPRFSDNRQRFSNRHALWTLLDAAFLAAPAQHWVDQFNRVSIPVGVVNTLDNALAHPQILHRQMVLELESETGNKIRVAGNPIKFGGTEAAERYTYPPRLGGDSSAILKEILGLSDASIEALFEAGIVQPSSAAAATRAG